MTSSTSSSGRGRAGRAICLAAALLLACAHAPPRPAEARRRPAVAVLPLDNLSGGSAPLRDLLPAVETALAREGFQVVGGEAVQQFLARHRIRYTGAIDGPSARAAREELGVEGVVITSLDQYGADTVPRFGAVMRLVSTEEQPRIVWIDAYRRSGNDSPGLLGLGLVGRVEVLRDEALSRLAASMARALDGDFDPSQPCGGERRFRPRVRYRAAVLPPDHPYSVAVVPFANRTGRRGAGDAVALEVVRQLVSSGRFRVLEPGVVRDVLLRYRVVMSGGVSLDSTRLLIGTLGADLVMGGDVLEFGDLSGRGPGVGFSTVMLERGSGQIVWGSTSYARGEDGVWFFGVGRVRTAPDLACRMVAAVVDRMTGSSARPGAVAAPAEAPTAGAGQGPPSLPAPLHRGTGR